MWINCNREKISFFKKLSKKVRKYSGKAGNKEKNFKNGHNKKTPAYTAT